MKDFGQFHFEGDAFFPEIDKTKWKTVFTKTFKADDCNKYDLDFFIMVKFFKNIFIIKLKFF